MPLMHGSSWSLSPSHFESQLNSFLSRPAQCLNTEGHANHIKELLFVYLKVSIRNILNKAKDCNVIMNYCHFRLKFCISKEPIMVVKCCLCSIRPLVGGEVARRGGSCCQTQSLAQILKELSIVVAGLEVVWEARLSIENFIKPIPKLHNLVIHNGHYCAD